MVIKQHHIPLRPVMRIHIPRTDRRPLQPVDDLAHADEVVDDGARGQVDLADGGRLDLEGEVARHRVSPGHGEDLDLGWVDGGEVGGGNARGSRSRDLGRWGESGRVSSRRIWLVSLLLGRKDYWALAYGCGAYSILLVLTNS